VCGFDLELAAAYADVVRSLDAEPHQARPRGQDGDDDAVVEDDALARAPRDHQHGGLLSKRCLESAGGSRGTRDDGT
jgi:hypothetical protein